LIAYILLTTVTFILWGIDKYRAKMGMWRVPEKILITLTIIGGAFGALAGMLVFRHKNRKTYFWILVIAACLIHAAVIVTTGLLE